MTFGERMGVIKDAAERACIFIDAPEERQAWVLGVMNALEVLDSPLLKDETALKDFAEKAALL